MTGPELYVRSAALVWPVAALFVGYRARCTFGVAVAVGAVLAAVWPLVLALAYLVRPRR